MSKAVRRPRVQFDGRGHVATHGTMTPARGIWHDTEGHDVAGIADLEGVVSYWEHQGLGYGAHVIIDKEGNSALCANLTDITWHTENRNTGSVGIELIGFASFTSWYDRPLQLDKLARWMAYISQQYRVPLSFNVNSGWSGHRDQTFAFHLPSGHTDPGSYFPKAHVISLATKYRKEGWS